MKKSSRIMKDSLINFHKVNIPLLLASISRNRTFLYSRNPFFSILIVTPKGKYAL